LSRDFLTLMMGEGALIAVAVMVAYYMGLSVSTATASTMAFATLTQARLFHGFNCRSTHSIFKLGFRSNWYSVGAFLLGTGLLAAVLLIPGLKGLFSVAALTGAQVGAIAGLAFGPTVVIQMVKVIRENM
jgi:Ca2+-transporting ATPase